MRLFCSSKFWSMRSVEAFALKSCMSIGLGNSQLAFICVDHLKELCVMETRMWIWKTKNTRVWVEARNWMLLSSEHAVGFQHVRALLQAQNLTAHWLYATLETAIKTNFRMGKICSVNRQYWRPHWGCFCAAEEKKSYACILITIKWIKFPAKQLTLFFFSYLFAWQMNLEPNKIWRYKKESWSIAVLAGRVNYEVLICKVEKVPWKKDLDLRRCTCKKPIMSVLQ